MRENVVVIIPSLNPDEKLMEVVKGLLEANFSKILLVDDGSDSLHKKPFEEASTYNQCKVLVHEVNKGKGRGLKTAFKYVIDNYEDIDGVITVDGDNQHKVKDIINCVDKMLELKDTVVLGCRDFSGSDVPQRSKFGNNMTKNVFKYLCGIKVSDTQTGLRAIPAMYLQNMIDIVGERYEYETNMLLEMKEQEIPFTEVSIETVYIEENETSHFNPLVDSFKIYKVIFKFMLSSISSCVIDLVMFAIALACLNNAFGDVIVDLFGSKFNITIMEATIIARIVSSIFNYTMNKKAVFKSKSSVKSTLIRYYVLCIVQMIVSGGLVTGACMLLSIESEGITTVIKAIIDTLLFLVSFPIQRKWVFKK